MWKPWEAKKWLLHLVITGASKCIGNYFHVVIGRWRGAGGETKSGFRFQLAECPGYRVAADCRSLNSNTAWVCVGLFLEKEVEKQPDGVICLPRGGGGGRGAKFDSSGKAWALANFPATNSTTHSSSPAISGDECWLSLRPPYCESKHTGWIVKWRHTGRGSTAHTLQDTAFTSSKFKQKNPPPLLVLSRTVMFVLWGQKQTHWNPVPIGIN